MPLGHASRKFLRPWKMLNWMGGCNRESKLLPGCGRNLPSEFSPEFPAGRADEPHFARMLESEFPFGVKHATGRFRFTKNCGASVAANRRRRERPVGVATGVWLSRSGENPRSRAGRAHLANRGSG